jgi:hypothetical protein
MTPPEPAAAQAGTGVLHDALNERPAVQRQFALSAALNHEVVQPKWLKGDGAVLHWDKLMNGLQWFYDPESQKMWFQRVEKGHQREDEGKLSGERLTYDQWLGLGWGTKSEEYKAMVKAGKPRWERLQKSFSEGSAGSIPEESQKARDAFFAGRYKTTDQGDEYETDLKSTLKNNVGERGVYTNTARLHEGSLAAHHNYAATGNQEVYDDPGTKKKEKFSNSEILYQQWRHAAKLYGKEKTPPLKTLKRAHISGEEGLPMAKALAMAVYGEDFVAENRAFTPGDEAFYALLALPNVVSALWLISDHGRELGISGIESITLMKGFSALITFESAQE